MLDLITSLIKLRLGKRMYQSFLSHGPRRIAYHDCFSPPLDLMGKKGNTVQAEEVKWMIWELKTVWNSS